MHTVLNNNLLKQKVDQNELMTEIVKSIKLGKPTSKAHEIIHLMVYKYCSKIINKIAKMQVLYDDFVNDVYIYSVQQVIKFKPSDNNHPFSYFTSVIANQCICQTKKIMCEYSKKMDYLREMEEEKKIIISTDIYRIKESK